MDLKGDRTMAALAPARKENQTLRPFAGFGSLGIREEMEDLMAKLFGQGEEMWPFGRVSPSLDLAETDQAIEARLDLPGVDPKEIDIQINANMLTVSGQRKEEKEEKGKTYHRVERRAGSFSRSVSLPCAVKEEAVEAKYHDGVLTITMPKTEEAKSRKIEVKT
jgi:HSP20 family protein